MRRLLLLLLAVSLPASAQAPAMRPPATPPVATPNFFPGNTGNPVHTPAGAGASHGGLAEPEKEVPRSPNKRLLPPTKEAGLWAADGAPVGIGGPRLFGVEIPYMRNEHGIVVPGETAWCAQTVTKATDAAGLREQVAAYSVAERACMAATTYLRCAMDQFRWTADGLTLDQRGGSLAYHDAKATLDHARSLEALLCRDSPLNDEQQRALQAIFTEWRTTIREFR